MESKPADYTLEKVLGECQEVFDTKPPHIGEVVHERRTRAVSVEIPHIADSLRNLVLWGIGFPIIST